ncbi:FecR family protein [Sunxiuqinia sp. A32]|uniref:FecR family protein n=1 Tax=Sunxiuqinia sp. A32 TaxID=3461496 RepID=UPI004045DD21
MNRRKQNICEKLLADNRFLMWALGKSEEDSKYWELWKDKNSESLEEFDQAFETVQLFKFKSPDISTEEVAEYWLKSKSKMKVRHLPSFRKTVHWYQRIAGILIIPILLFSVWFFYTHYQLKYELNNISEYHQKKSIRVVAPLGGQLQVELPDGSQAWLNSGSELRYPASFAENIREVEMTGEIYFKVVKSEEVFVVRNPGPSITVHGTEFNVHAYPDENNITIALAEGIISLDENGKELMMNEGEVAFYDVASGSLKKDKSDVYPYTSWREGKYIFRNATLESILKTLERNYNVKIYLEDSTMNQFTYDATINGEPLEEILELLSFSAPVKYEYKKRQIKADGSYTKAEVRLWKDNERVVNH